jgi:hypothetical protein
MAERKIRIVPGVNGWKEMKLERPKNPVNPRIRSRKLQGTRDNKKECPPGNAAGRQASLQQKLEPWGLKTA